jgi:diacylglycerol kinase (ATP)
MQTRSKGPAAPTKRPRSPIVVIVNPSKRRSDEALDAIRQACREAGLPSPTVLQTTVEHPGGLQAREAIASRAELVIAAGGDGTVREIASVLAGTDIALGVVPIGTANLLARNLGLRPSDLARNAAHAVSGHDRSIDVGRIWLDIPDQHNPPHEAVFLVVAGFGMDAAAISKTSEVLKRRLGWVAYFDSLARRVFEISDRIEMSLDNGPARCMELRTLMIGNCGLIPAGIRLIPNAVLDDGMLDVVIMTPTTPIGWIPIAGKILLRHKYKIASLLHHPARNVTLRPSHPLAVQLDGDVIDAVSAARISIEPGALRIRSVRPDGARQGPLLTFPWQRNDRGDESDG